MIWNSLCVYVCSLLCSLIPCTMHACAFMYVLVTCVSALQVLLRQLAEIQVFPWMAAATGKDASPVTLWPSLVIRDMNCRGRAESPASKWKIDTTGNPALQAASVRDGDIVWVRDRRGDVWRRQQEVYGLKEGSVGDQTEWEMVRRRGSEGVFLLTCSSRDYNSLSLMS